MNLKFKADDTAYKYKSMVSVQEVSYYLPADNHLNSIMKMQTEKCIVN